MQTFLYNLETNKQEGPIREGYFTVDGQRPTLIYPIVEIEIVNNENPIFDSSTQKLVYSEYLDLDNKKFIKGYVVVDLTPEEIENLNSQPTYGVPETCTPRQFRLALLDFGIDPDSISQIIDSFPDPEQRKRISIIWEYSNSIERADPLIEEFARIMSVPVQTVDAIFVQANSYE